MTEKPTRAFTCGGCHHVTIALGPDYQAAIRRTGWEITADGVRCRHCV